MGISVTYLRSQCYIGDLTSITDVMLA